MKRKAQRLVIDKKTNKIDIYIQWYANDDYICVSDEYESYTLSLLSSLPFYILARETQIKE